ncbi:MAG: NAD-dependent epimerase/dehydratase family protein [Planctomycetaceae bacterium]
MSEPHHQSSQLNRVAIVGGSGFYGHALIRELRRSHPSATILSLDVAEPRETGAADEFVKLDVRSDELTGILEKFTPDTIIHLAFIVDPIRNDDFMHDVNVNGTKNVFKAVEKIQPKRFLLSSSATAYGAWPDNPVPLVEDSQLRGRKEYRYSNDKVAIEGMLVDFSKQNPEISVSWTRPAIIYEEGINNYLTEFIAKGPLIVLPDKNNTEMQFVHADDVAAATRLILEKNATGPFNVGPNDWISLAEMAKMSKRPTVTAPLRFCMFLTKCWWGLRLPLFHFPPALWYYIRYPWVVRPQRLMEELGYEFKYSSRETLQHMFDCLRTSRSK